MTGNQLAQEVVADVPVHGESDLARTTTGRRVLGMTLLIGCLLLAFVASIALGARPIPPLTVIDALLGRLPADNYDAAVVFSERLPRALLAPIVGAALGVAGVIMQAVTHNPLVDGGILGTELGAACAVVIAITAFGVVGANGYFWFALAGAVVVTAATYCISRLTAAVSTAVSLVIAGAAISALLGALINLILIRDTAAFTRYRFWSVGQVAGRAETMESLWPIAAVGLVAALCCGGVLNALAMGDTMAAGLGVRVRRAQLATMGIAVLLCAVATATCGPIGFVGLVAAHLARLIVGADQRWLLPYGMVCGAVLLVVADVAGRLVPGYGEVPVGIMTAVIGTPIFVVLVKTRQLAEA